MNSAYPNQRAAETPGNRTAEPATPAQAKTDGPDYDFEKDLQRHTDDSAEPEEQRVRLSIAKRIAKRIHDLRRSNPTITSAKMRHALLNEGFADDSIANHVNVPAIALKQGYLVQTVISCEKVLERLCVYYQRGGELVKPVLGKDADFAASTAIRRHPESVVIQPATFTSVQWELAHSGRFIKYIRSGAGFKPIPADPTEEIAKHIIDRVRTMPAEVPYPVLDMVVNTPVLLPDGTVLTHGYKNDVLVMSSHNCPEVPDRPTKEDAIAALKKFDAIFCKFPFKTTDEHQKWNDTPSYSCVLAGALSLVARPALPTVPLFVVSAPTPGTGKTKIIEAAGSAMLGYKPTAVTFNGTAEFQKLLLPLLRGQDRIILIDNLSMPIQGDKLNVVLTASSFRDRILGLSKDIQLFNRAVFFASGNNIQVEGDLGRRTLQITVDAGVESPEERRFDFDPVELAATLHPELVIAGLTALRAYILAGQPDVLDRALLGSFEAWDRLICGTLVWCGYADPTLTRADVAENNPEHDFGLAILEAWDEAYGRGPVSVVEIGQGEQGESESEIKLARLLSRQGEFNPRSAGHIINRLLNRPIGGWKLVKAGYRKYKLEDNRPR